MFCPECRAEYREGFTRCEECDVALVESLPPETGGEPVEVVFQTADASLVPVIRSLLESAEIPFVLQGAGASALFPLGPMGGSRDDRDLGVVVHVPRSRVEDAKQLLDGLPMPEVDALEGGEPPDPVEPGDG